VNPLDAYRLDDRVVVLTGASSGLGVGFARAVAAVGAHLVLAARRSDRLGKLVAELTRSNHAANRARSSPGTGSTSVVYIRSFGFGSRVATSRARPSHRVART
jgi:NAD(P)-dependent dehydrogenase (short-subunit alcohol dehydrogenase family)